MYRRSELSPTLTNYSKNNTPLSPFQKQIESTIETANVNDNHYRNDDQQLSEASTSIDVSSIVDNSINMDQLPISSHTHGKLQKKGKLVTFFRNGDQYFKGITIPISQKWFVTLETLIAYLNEKISTPTGVRYIFDLSNGDEIKNVGQFKPGESYIVSSVKKLVQHIHYGEGSENFWINKPPSASKIRKNDHYLFTKNYEEINQLRSYQNSVRDSKKNENIVFQNRVIKSKIPKQKPIGREIIVISNTHRKSFYIMIVEREGDKKFEDVLFDISDMLDLSYPPIQTLYTSSKPYKRVCSFSQFFKEYLHEESFIACGSEFYPIEMKKKLKKNLNNEEIYPLSSDSKNSYLTNSVHSYESKSTQTVEQYSSSEPTKEAISNGPNISSQKSQLTSPQYITINGKEKIVYSSKLQHLSSKKPSSCQFGLKLNWIYGINSNIANNFLDVISPDEFIYCVGKVAIIYNIAKYQQRYFMEHTSSISCFVIHSNKRYIASSQNECDSKSLIYIWTADECVIISIITGSLSEYIFSMDFSNDGNGEFLVVIDSHQNSANQNLKIYNWQKNIKVATTNCNREQITGVRFHPDDNSTLITNGYQHINIWRIFWQEKGLGKILRDKKSGLFEFCIPEYVNCLAFDLMGNIVSGDSNGSIHLWTRDEEEAFINRTVPQLYHAHKDKVSCLLLIGDGTLISASKNSIKAWDSFNDFKFVKERNIPTNHGKIKSIVSCHPERIDGKLWIGTDLSTVLEGTLQDSFVVLFQHHSHPVSPLQLIASPNEHSFITGGSDHLVMKWSLLQQRMLWTVSIDNDCSAMAYYTDGHYIAIGTLNGKLIIIQSKTGTHVMSLQVDLNQNPISCLQYSPDGKLLCIGCLKSDLKMFSILDQGSFCRHLSNMEFKNSANVLRIDWCKNSQTIRTEDVDYNVKLWSVSPTVKEKGAAEIVHLEFASENCLVTFNNLNLWKSHIDELCVVKKAMNVDQIVYGTSNGIIGLANFLLKTDITETHQMCVGAIKSIAISFDDSYVLVSSDDKNCSNVFQWNIIDG